MGILTGEKVENLKHKTPRMGKARKHIYVTSHWRILDGKRATEKYTKALNLPESHQKKGKTSAVLLHTDWFPPKNLSAQPDTTGEQCHSLNKLL